LLSGTTMRRVVLVLAFVGCASPAHDNGPDAAAGDDVDASLGVDAAIDAPPPPMIEILRGVDRASAFSIAEAKTLHDAHGVKWTGVYIGGPCSAGSGWTKSLLTSMHDQLGWTFMPIYVGQQSSAICGAHTLTAAQGTTDGEAAVAKMQTFGWMPDRDIPVCLDLEAGAYSSNPAGARAYAKAWRDAVRTGGYLAYLYSNPTAINNLFDNNIKFDGAWPASWFYTSFHDSAPEDLDQLGTRYTNKNRAWQYAGSFAVSGAGSVDGDTSDLLLAPKPGGTNK
jgi:Rv2525c-like, glycoside hydrolase-like domain